MLLNLPMRDYEQAERYLLEIPKFTSKNPLEETRNFYRYLFSYVWKENHFEEKIIHVAGTNGKGSVCAYLQNILMQSGKKVGMFTSPHLVTMRERFQINQENVSKETFVEALTWVIEQLEQYNRNKAGDYKPTFFEMLFFMCIYIFCKQDVDIILLETGLGGRLDATNVTQAPLLTVITEIGLDHMQYLGDTIEKIAGEKAGIIKRGVPVVTGEHNAEKEMASQVILQRAKDLQAPVYGIHKEEIRIANIREKSIDFFVKSRYYDYIRLTAATPALYQTENAALAVRAIDALMDVWHTKGCADSITEEMIQKGIHGMRWEARMEEIMPRVFIDGGHNVDGIKAFLETVNAREKFRKTEDKNILLFSAVNDKAYEEMIPMLAEASLFDVIYITEISGARRTAAEELRDIFQRYTRQQIQIFKDVRQAWERCLADKGENDTVYVVGSLYLAGLMKEIL